MELFDISTIIYCIVYKLKRWPRYELLEEQGRQNKFVKTIKLNYENKFVIDPNLVDN